MWTCGEDLWLTSTFWGRGAKSNQSKIASEEPRVKKKSNNCCPVSWLSVAISFLCGRKHQRPLSPERLSHSSSLTDSAFAFPLNCTTHDPRLPAWAGPCRLYARFSASFPIDDCLVVKYSVRLRSPQIGRWTNTKRRFHSFATWPLLSLTHPASQVFGQVFGQHSRRHTVAASHLSQPSDSNTT